MNAVYERNMFQAVGLCDSLISREHEVLNEARCLIALVGTDFERLARGAQNHLALREVKVDIASLTAAKAKGARQSIHLLQHRHELCIVLAELRLVVRDNLVDSRIREPSIGTDQRLTDFMPHLLACSCEFHETGECTAILALV